MYQIQNDQIALSLSHYLYSQTTQISDFIFYLYEFAKKNLKQFVHPSAYGTVLCRSPLKL